MSTARQQILMGTTRIHLINAAIAGIIGAAVFGLYAQALVPDFLGLVGALYGVAGNTTVGWIAHLIHGAVFGVGYAVITAINHVQPYSTDILSGAGVGLGYSIVLWLVFASIVMPLWLGTVTTISPAVPQFDIFNLIGHAIFGVLLGGLYPWLLSQ